MPSPFVITTAGETIKLGPGDSGKVAVTISNKTDTAIRGQLKLRPQGQVEAEWLKLEGEGEREFEAKGSIQVNVEIAPPDGTHVGRYEFRLDAASVENPDEEYTEGPLIIFELSEPKPEPKPVVEEKVEEKKKPFPWWMVGAGGGVLLLIIILVVAFSGGDDDDVEVVDEPEESSGLVGHWKLDTASISGEGGEVPDSSDNDNTGISKNEVKVKGHNNILVAEFDGEGAYIEIPNDPTLQVTESMTVCFWINPENIGDHRINPLDKNDEGEFSLVIEVGGNLSYYHGDLDSDAGFFRWTALPTGTLQNENWQHVAIVRDATDQVVKSYLNGDLKEASSYSGNASFVHRESNDPIKIGTGYANNNEGHLKGQMSDVRIYSKALSQGEIRVIHSETLGQ